MRERTGRGAEQRAIARIDLSALRANYRLLSAVGEGRDLIAVVKADAYGHGAIEATKALIEEGCRFFAIATVSEAVELRRAGIEQSILLMGGVNDLDEAREAASWRVTPTINHEREVGLLVTALETNAKPLFVQVQVDTGMRRMGVPAQAALPVIRHVASHPRLRLAGVFTHLAQADELDLEPSREQLRRFGELLRALRAEGIDPGQTHAQNSAGLLAASKLSSFLEGITATRPGLGLYGISPAPHFSVALEPVMSLSARVVGLRSVEEGDPVGYGATHRCLEGHIATLAVGYADGIRWTGGNRGSVLLRGRRAPIVGRISMDYVTVFVDRETRVEIGDRALLFGRSSEGELAVLEMAEAAGTIPYETVTCLGRRVARVFDRP